jgi:exodeoxyribonuclease V alpha subunit
MPAFNQPAQSPFDAGEPGELEGVIERIVYENPETGFLVGRLRRDNAHELDTFVGSLIAVSPGESVRLRGRWIDDQKFGRQLRIESYEVVVPSSIEGIEKYLGSGLITGIGPHFAKKLVAAFGAETLRVIDEQPERLRRVPGIGAKRAQDIRAAWESQKAIQAIMIFLQGHGIRPAQAARIYQAYGDKAMAVMRNNPYQLAEDINGIGFQGADQIAQKMGLAQDAPQRLEAGLRHALLEAMGEGHVFLDKQQLLEDASRVLGVKLPQLAAPLDALLAREGLVREGDAIYLPHLRDAEAGVAQQLKRLLGAPSEMPSIHVENAIKWVEREQGIQLSEGQREAIRLGCESKVLVITGGPGTGKTTILKGLLAILEKKGLSFLLAAPTGRAAKRMEAATERSASTLHRLLEYSPRKHGFTRNETDPLVTDLLVADEASMIDIHLMHALLKALPPFARLLLVGDVDQLPSVGPGNVLFDLIASGMVPVARLQTVFRQADESGIIHNAHRVNRGLMPDFNTTDFMLVKRESPEAVLETIVELVVRRMPQGLGLDPLRDVQVLSPMRRGDAGTVRINEALQQALNPSGVPIAGRGFRLGDKVMQLRNNYELEVFNGDVGILSTNDPEGQEVEVTFDDGRKVIYPYRNLDELALAYAMTIHKSQGSEYNTIVIPVVAQHFMMLQRNVLYTGITRGKARVILVGEPKAVAMAVRNSNIARRNTRLTGRMRNETAGARQ